jgi:hypothetical protein
VSLYRGAGQLRLAAVHNDAWVFCGGHTMFDVTSTTPALTTAQLIVRRNRPECMASCRTCLGSPRTVRIELLISRRDLPCRGSHAHPRSCQTHPARTVRSACRSRSCRTSCSTSLSPELVISPDESLFFISYNLTPFDLAELLTKPPGGTRPGRGGLAERGRPSID